MKNAHKNAERLKSLFRSLLREGKPPPIEPADPLRAVVRAGMAYDVSDAKANEAMKAIEREFVDLNELRVATELEIQELLGVRYPAIEERVQLITQALNAIFAREHTLSLDRMKELPKRDVRQFLRDLPSMNPFMEAYVMLHAFDAPAMPVDAQTAAFLREEQCIDGSTELAEVQRFVEHHIRPEDSYDFYAALRRAMYDEKRKKKSRA